MERKFLPETGEREGCVFAAMDIAADCHPRRFRDGSAGVPGRSSESPSTRCVLQRPGPAARPDPDRLGETRTYRRRRRSSTTANSSTTAGAAGRLPGPVRVAATGPLRGPTPAAPARGLEYTPRPSPRRLSSVACAGRPAEPVWPPRPCFRRDARIVRLASILHNSLNSEETRKRKALCAPALGLDPVGRPMSHLF